LVNIQSGKTLVLDFEFSDKLTNFSIICDFFSVSEDILPQKKCFILNDEGGFYTLFRIKEVLGGDRFSSGSGQILLPLSQPPSSDLNEATPMSISWLPSIALIQSRV